MMIVNSKSVFQFLIRMNLHLGKRNSSAELLKISEDWVQACKDWKVTPEKFESASRYLLSTCDFFPTLPDFLRAMDQTWSKPEIKAIESDQPKQDNSELFSKKQSELNKMGVNLLVQVVEGQILLEKALAQLPVDMDPETEAQPDESHFAHFFQGKPYVSTHLSPENIIREDEDLFKRHYEFWFRNEGQESKIHRSFSEQELSRISEINGQLLDNGYRVAGISPEGDLKWSLVSEMHSLA